MHIIITGATGFIGRGVVYAALGRGHTVTAIVRDENKARTFLPTQNSALTLAVCAGFEEVDLNKLDIPQEDKTRQDKTRQDKTRQDKTRQDKTHSPCMG